MKLILSFPDINRKKSYKSIKRHFNVFINGKKTYTINQEDPTEGSLDVKIGDKIFVDKRFASAKKDASFYYIVGEPTAELINQQGKKKNVYTDAMSSGVLFILDDNDYKKAINVAK